MTNSECEMPDNLRAEEIRVALEQILASPEIRSSHQLAAFLRFVVEATLAGESDRIKAYTIAVAALGRADTFDPQADPIVRVEAGRLRRALERYYARSGAEDAVEIELPRGSYVPVFHRRTRHVHAPAPAARRRKLLSLRPPAWPTTAAFVGIVLLSGIVIATRYWPAADEFAATNGAAPVIETTSRLRPGRGMPVVSVQPFDLTGMRADQATPIEGLRRKLRDALARFDEIEVAAEIAPSEKARADYYLAATAEWQRKGAISLDFRLLDAGDDTVAWTRSFANLPGSGDPAAIQDDVVRQVVATLAPPYGVIYARELTRHTGNNRDPRYLCMLDSFEYRRNYAFERRVRVRACLRKVLELDPTFAGGFAAVTTIALYDYFYLDGGQRALDEALNAAKRAVELAPESARAHQAMMNVLFARDQVPGALGEGAKAVQLNPLDMLVLATYGMRLVSAGEIDRGRAALNQAAALGSVRPAFLDFFLFVSAYLRGDDASAAFHASLLTSEAYPFALVARALVAAKAGNLDRARQIVDRLLALHPQWRSNAREAMLRYIHSTAIVDRLAGDLAPAGFPDRR